MDTFSKHGLKNACCACSAVFSPVLHYSFVLERRLRRRFIPNLPFPGRSIPRPARYLPAQQQHQKRRIKLANKAFHASSAETKSETTNQVPMFFAALALLSLHCFSARTWFCVDIFPFWAKQPAVPCWNCTTMRNHKRIDASAGAFRPAVLCIWSGRRHLPLPRQNNSLKMRVYVLAHAVRVCAHSSQCQCTLEPVAGHSQASVRVLSSQCQGNIEPVSGAGASSAYGGGGPGPGGNGGDRWDYYFLPAGKGVTAGTPTFWDPARKSLGLGPGT
eukprot:gene9927-biopygen202